MPGTRLHRPLLGPRLGVLRPVPAAICSSHRPSRGTHASLLSATAGRMLEAGRRAESERRMQGLRHLGRSPLGPASPSPGAPDGRMDAGPSPTGHRGGSPGDDPDVKPWLAPGVHESQQPPLEVREAVHVALHEVHLVLEQQRRAHLRGVGGAPSGCRPQPVCRPGLSEEHTCARTHAQAAAQATPCRGGEGRGALR